MVRKSKQKIEELESQIYSLKWEKADIYASQIDPDMKAIYINDVDYKVYCLEQEIEAIEHEEAMLPLKLMLAGFIIFVVILLIYRVSN
jgi:hypothetical protein